MKTRILRERYISLTIRCIHAYICGSVWPKKINEVPYIVKFIYLYNRKGAIWFLKYITIEIY